MIRRTYKNREQAFTEDEDVKMLLRFLESSERGRTEDDILKVIQWAHGKMMEAGLVEMVLDGDLSVDIRDGLVYLGIPEGRSYGTGRVFPRGKTWWIAYHVDGREIRESSGSTKKHAAEEMLKQRLEAAAATKKKPAPDTPTRGKRTDDSPDVRDVDGNGRGGKLEAPPNKSMRPVADDPGETTKSTTGRNTPRRDATRQPLPPPVLTKLGPEPVAAPQVHVPPPPVQKPPVYIPPPKVTVRTVPLSEFPHDGTGGKIPHVKKSMKQILQDYPPAPKMEHPNLPRKFTSERLAKLYMNQYRKFKLKATLKEGLFVVEEAS